MNQLNKLIIPISIVIAGGLIAFSIYYTSSREKPVANGTVPNPIAQVQVQPVSSADHIRGKANAKVVIIDYSDYECPFCKNFHATLSKIFAEYSSDNRVAWVYRHFPLDIHPKARKEAEAAECANELGGADAFWKFSDRIYEITPANNKLEESELYKLANELNLDEANFRTCYTSGKYAAKVEEQYQSALAAGGRGTPYTVIVANGETIPLVDEQGRGLGALDYTAMKTIVEQFLK